MNKVIENMKTRRSVRAFADTPVQREILDAVVEAGIYAPSGRNRQSAAIIAVTDADTLDKLRRVNAEILGSGQSDPFYGAPAVMIVLAKKDVPTHVYDGALVMENIMLAAHSLGVSSCWIHRAKETFERADWQAWLKEVGLEGEYEGIGHVALGYPAVKYPDAPPRREGRVFYV